MFSLIIAFSALFGGIATFDTWQPVVRLGVRAPRMLGLTLSAGILLDVSAAMFAAIAAIAATVIVGTRTSIPAEYLCLAQLHALSLLGGIAGTPKGYFRLAERFDILAGNQVMLALAMTFASLALWWGGAELVTYVAVFALVGVIYNLTLMLRMLITLRRDGVRLSLPFASRRGRRVLWIMFRVATGTSILSTLNSSRHHLALLLVGGLLGEVAAGVLTAAARFASAASKFGNLAMQVLFKTVLQAAKRHEPAQWRSKVLRTTAISALLAAALALVAIPSGTVAIPLFLGDGYTMATAVFAGLFAAECATLATIHLNPVIQQNAGPRPLVSIAAASLVVHLATIVVLAPVWGAVGAGVASFLASLGAAVMMAITADRKLRQAIVRR